MKNVLARVIKATERYVLEGLENLSFILFFNCVIITITSNL